MLAMTPERMNAIQRAGRALLIFFIFMSVISLLSTLSNVVHPFPADTRTLAGVELHGAVHVLGSSTVNW